MSLPGVEMPAHHAGDEVEVFYRMPYGEDNNRRERFDDRGNRWVLCPSPLLGSNRPRIGWTERWLPGTVIDQPKEDNPAKIGLSCAVGQSYDNRRIHFRWDVRMWFDWASGEQIQFHVPAMMTDKAPLDRVRDRSKNWQVQAARSRSSTPCGSELQIGSVPVEVSFIVFRWGAAKIPIEYDSHSWGRSEGSTVSARFIRQFFNRSVVPRLGCNYEVLTVFVQQSDEFARISPEFLASICNGRRVVALYFLWPIQGQQTYGDRLTTTAAYVDADPFYDLVSRMESAGIVTRWPHHLQLWRSLSSKDWVPNMCVTPKYHVPLTTTVPKSLILVDSLEAARFALEALWRLQEERCQESGPGCYPAGSDWSFGATPECVAKLGFSYEGIDVRMAYGRHELADALHTLATQPGYKSDCVYVQQRVRQVDLEARCFVLNGEVVGTLWTRFARIDHNGYVRDYEKSDSEDDALRNWFYNDRAAWVDAQRQIRLLTRRWHNWMLARSAEPTVSVRIDYMLHRITPGKCDVWTGELGEQGYSMGGINPELVFDAVLDTIVPAANLKRNADVCDNDVGTVGDGNLSDKMECSVSVSNWDDDEEAA